MKNDTNIDAVLQMLEEYRMMAPFKYFNIGDDTYPHVLTSPGFLAMQMEELGYGDFVLESFGGLWANREYELAETLLTKALNGMEPGKFPHLVMLLAYVRIYKCDGDQMAGSLIIDCMENAPMPLAMLGINILFQTALAVEDLSLAHLCTSGNDFQNAEFQLHKGRLALYEGDMEKAEECFRTVIRVASDSKSDEFIQIQAISELNNILHIFTSKRGAESYLIEE